MVTTKALPSCEYVFMSMVVLSPEAAVEPEYMNPAAVRVALPVFAIGMITPEFAVAS